MVMFVVIVYRADWGCDVSARRECDSVREGDLSEQFTEYVGFTRQLS